MTKAVQRVNKARKVRMVKELLCSGVSSQAEIRRLMEAGGVPIGKATVCRYVSEILKEWSNDVAPELRETWRGTELAKLNKMERTLAPMCHNAEDTDTALKAMNTRLKLLQHRAKLLGLTDPDTINVILTPEVVMQRMKGLPDGGTGCAPVIPGDADYEVIDADGS